MNEPLIKGGYILLSRKIIDSEIFKKPPLYLKIWIYLLSRAQHESYKGLERGQLYTSIPEIQEVCSYMVGYRKVTPTKDQVYQVLEWLRNPDGKNLRNVYEGGNEADTKATMITTTKATHGILVNIENYSFYQDTKNYESNDENDNEKAAKPERKQRQPDNINKNDNNDKNDNKNIYDDAPELNKAILQFIEFRKKIKAPMTDRAIELLILKLQRLSPDISTQIAIINQSILNGWKGVFPLKEPEQPKTNKFNQHQQRNYTQQDYAELEKQLLRRSSDE